MFRSLAVTLRTLAIFAFLLAMPLLAFPPVARRLEAAFAQFRPQLGQLFASTGANVFSSAPGPAPSAPPPMPLPLPIPSPPPMPLPPSDEQSPLPSETPPQHEDGDKKGGLDGLQGSRESQILQAARRRLERLGARSISLQPVAGSGVRSTCHVPLSRDSLYSKPFEACGADAADAIARLETAVEAWSTSAGQP